MQTKLIDIFSEIITGVWGDEDIAGTGVSVVKTSSFQNDGKIDFSENENRLIRKKIKDEYGKVQYVTDEEKIENKKLQDGDIIIEKSGGGIGTPVGRVVFFSAPDKKTYLCNNFTQTLRVNTSIAHPRFIFYYLKYLYRRGTVLKYQNQTTGLFNLKIERYLNEVVEIPTYDKQLAIATQLNTVQRLIDSRKQTLKILDDIIESVYIMLFGNPISNPKNWPKEKLNNFGKWHSGGTPKTTEEQFYNGNIPWFTSGELTDVFINESKKLITKKGLEKSNAKLIKVNSIMIGLYDTAAFNMSINKIECASNQAILYSKLNDDFYTLFVYYTLLISKDYYLSKRKGARQKNLSSTFIKNIEIVYPKSKSDKKVIEKFYKYFQLYFSLKTDQEMSLQNLGEIFDSILTYSFKLNQVNTIDEESIFKELIKKFTIDDLTGNKKRLQYLVDLFDSSKFDSLDEYSNAKEKLFQLIDQDQITQELTNNRLKLQVK